VAWVIAFHVYALRRTVGDPWVASMASSPLEPVVGAGYLGVDLFFLISGFLLALPWFLHAGEGRAAPSARAFYARRVRRIVPAYYVQLVFLFAVVLPLLAARATGARISTSICGMRRRTRSSCTTRRRSPAVRWN
jgi:peptidoglycan/LPS O-acetylase OafA/YrhL